MTIGNYFINFAAIGLAIVLLIILGLIYKRGNVEVTEPRRVILVIEVALMLAIIGLALYNLIIFIFPWG